MWYTIQRHEQRFGPYSREDVQRYAADGRLLPTDLVWGEETQRWLPLRDLFIATVAPPPPPPPPPLATALRSPIVSAAPVTPDYAAPTTPSINNRVAYISLGAIWVAWFLLPFVNIGWGPIQLANSSLWGLLGTFPVEWPRMLGLVSIVAPLLALNSANARKRLLNLMPLAYLVLGALVVQAQIDQMANQIRAENRGSPFFTAIGEAGLHAAIKAVSFEYGAYVLVIAAVLLAWQAFDHRKA